MDPDYDRPLPQQPRSHMDEDMQVSRAPLSGTDVSPDEMAQIPREVTMLIGAITSLHGRANDLIGRLAPAMRDVPEDEPLGKISEIPTKFPVSTELSRAIHDAWEECGSIERKLERAYNRLEL
jgi:hypothetical protein